MKPKSLTPDATQKLIEKLENLQNALIGRFNKMEDMLKAGEDVFLLFQDGLKARQERLLKGISLDPVTIWHERMRKDPELRHPHKKIMQTLLEQYDYGKKEFAGISTNELCRKAKVGKNLLKEYTSLLIQKGYIRRINQDNYRVFYKIRHESGNRDN